MDNDLNKNNLTLRKVDNSNLDEILNLRVNESQKNFIETTEECLNEARELNLWRPVGIYSGEELIGFSMYGLFKKEGKNGRVWLDRLLIDYKYQGRGYGKKSLELLLKILKLEYGYNEIFLSIYDDNKVGIKLYENIGFKFNGETDIKGEKVMVYKFSE